MKRKLGMLAVCLSFFLLSGISYADEARERLLREAEKRTAEMEERMAAEKAEAEAAAKKAEEERLAAMNEEERAQEMERLEAEKAANQTEEERLAAEKERWKHMTEAEKMDAEVQRIKTRMGEITKNIEEYKEVNEKIQALESNVKGLQERTNY